MSIEKLKEQARRFEQKEEWRKALEQYEKAIARLAEDDQPDIGLYNRVGDLYVRVGDLEDAVRNYEQAVDLYMEAELPNNAIAVCKKVIRNVPDRHEIYLKMARIRAGQGFLPDARANYLTYAERVAQAGDIEESLRALTEFADHAPEDVEVRLFVAEQMASHERVDEAVEQLSAAYRQLMATGDTEQAATVEARIRELAPDADLAAPAAAASEPDMGLEAEMGFEPGSGISDEGEIVAEFGEISLGGEEEAAEAVEEAVEEAAGFDLGGFEIAAEEEEAAQEEAGAGEEAVEAGEEAVEEEAFELPLMTFDDEEEEPGEEAAVAESVEEALELPMMDLGEEAAEASAEAEGAGEPGEEAAALDAAAFGEADHGERETQEYLEGPQEMGEIEVELGGLEAEAEGAGEVGDAVEAAMEEAAGEAAVEEAVEPAAPALPEEPAAEEAELSADELRRRIEESPDDVSLRQRMVEMAYAAGDEAALVEAYVGLGQALSLSGKGARAKAAFQQALDIDPADEAARAGLGETPEPSRPVKEVAAHEDYVDLGAMILGDEEEEKSTRFVVAYEEPSGDEQADFAKMLSQFKEKVSENLGADDVRAHHDLGTAYKEMGLLDEAIAEFQQALRASADHLPTYELMGQTFMEMGQSAAAVRTLERALEAHHDVEDELVGIYYYLARAYEEEGDAEKAVEFYERVFSLDINFADVTERLRALR
ncbi:MAG: tetratricopeptide repeat protein [Gemmatimonadota bacterium]